MSVERKELEAEQLQKQLEFLKSLMDLGESVDIKNVILSLAQVGGLGNILTEFPTDVGALCMSVMESIIDPIGVDGRIDQVVAYDNPVIRGQTVYYKYNMISNKRKGRMENTKIMAPVEEEAGLTGRIKQQVSPDSV